MARNIYTLRIVCYDQIDQTHEEDFELEVDLRRLGANDPEENAYVLQQLNEDMAAYMTYPPIAFFEVIEVEPDGEVNPVENPIGSRFIRRGNEHDVGNLQHAIQYAHLYLGRR